VTKARKMFYKEDLKGYLKIGKGEVPGILFCVFVAFVSYIVTRGTVFDDGPRLLPSSLFINDLVFSTLFKIGPIVLALILGC